MARISKPGATRVAHLNAAIRNLHEDLKSLVLVCAPNFPKKAKGGLKFLADVVDVQVSVAAYNREVLVGLFQMASSEDAASLVFQTASKFTIPWRERGRLTRQERRSETQIDSAVRKQLVSLSREMRPLGGDELRAANPVEEISGILFYLSTIEGSLCWYADRYLARLTGELGKMDGQKTNSGRAPR
jgi:hypothetical protein